MAQPALSTLISRTRRLLRDYGQAFDALTASCTSTATTLTVADATTTVYTANWPIEIDQETLVVVSGTGTTLTVRRGMFDSTNASHATSATIMIRPAFYSVEIIDALNEGIYASFPLVYKRVVDESLTTSADTYEYTIPAMPSDTDIVLPYIHRVSLKESGDTKFRELRGWGLTRGATPKLVFRREQPASASIRIEGFGPFPKLSATSDTLDAKWPRQAEDLAVLYAAGRLLASGEAARVRWDTGVTDNREQANRAGSSSAAGRDLLARFERRLAQAAMPPMPRAVPTHM